MKTLLVEIGTEEIPAGYIEPALEALAAGLREKLAAARIRHGELHSFGTPRRLAVLVAEVAARQEPLVREMLGPPAAVAFDAAGRPTTAAVKFAEKAGVRFEACRVVATPRGEYLSAAVKEPGRKTPLVLQEILPPLILGLPFPKRMRWADLAMAFARPIVWLLALYGASVIPVDLGGILSGRFTHGHRFHHPRRIRIARPEAWQEALRAAFVVADAGERRRRIAEDAAREAAAVGGRLVEDPELLATNTHLVEYPVVARGRFPEEFLELPPEVLITAMREHQKYFAVEDGSGRLLPWFVAVNNTRAADPAVVVRGHERVLRARLEDARFFYRTDLAVPLERQVEKLRQVLFQAKLGSVHDKVLRVRELAERLAAWCDPAEELRRTVGRAAWLCKADLVSLMVGEFPKLQGVMGRIYAAAQGEPEAVARAIEEHYRPTAAGGLLPETAAGAVLAVADKIDTLCGCFRTGLIPSGAADPYALRRQGIGVIQILRRHRFGWSLGRLIAEGLARYPDPEAAPPETARQLAAFLEGRLSSQLIEEGCARDTVAAVLAADADRVPDAFDRAAALEAFRRKPEFEGIALSFKRVVNILRRAEGFTPAVVQEERFLDPAEGALFAALRTIEGAVAQELQNGRHAAALARMLELKPALERFFEDVMVMDEDRERRENRLSLLARVAGLFERFADFSKLSA